MPKPPRHPPGSAEAKVSAMCKKLDEMEAYSTEAAEVNRDSYGSFRSSAAHNPIVTSGGSMADDDAGIINICSGLRYLPEGAKLRQTGTVAAYRSSVQPLPLEQLRKQIHEMETEATAPRKKMPSMPGREASARALGDPFATGETEEEEDNRPSKQFAFDPTGFRGPMTFAQALEMQSLRNDDVHLDSGLSSEARRNRKRQQEERRAERKASRAQRQHEADAARVAYGLTNKDRKERKKNALKFNQRAFEATQLTAAADFKKRGTRVIVANLATLLSQMLLMSDGYQAMEPSEQLERGQDPAPTWVFVYTLCGIIGSITALMSTIILFAVLFTQGLKARCLQNLCPISVHVQYLSSFLQLLSLFNHLGYLSTLFDRLSDRYPGPAGQSYWVVIYLLEFAIGPILPLVMAFTIFQAKQMCYVNLKRAISAEVIQKHIFYAIGELQIASSTLAIAVTTTNLFTLLNELSLTDAVAEDGSIASFDPFIINYTSFLFPLLGVFGLCLGLVYSCTVRTMSEYEIETLELDEKRENTLLAGSRVTLQKGNPCKLQHIVDKPSLNGQRGTIESTGPDENGRVLVSVEGKELRLEEFQIGVTTDDKELEDIKERAQLLAAKVTYDYEKKGSRLRRRQMFYVTAGQVMVGLIIVYLLFLLMHSRFNALSVYMHTVEALPSTLNDFAAFDFSDQASAASAVAYRQRTLDIQASLCDYWSQCFSDSPKSKVCGACVVTTPSRLSAATLARPSFSEGYLFQGYSLIILIIGASIGGVAFFIFGVIFLPSVAQMGCFMTLVTTFILVLLGACLGFTVAPLFYTLRNNNPLTASECASADLDAQTSTQEFVSMECLRITTAYKQHDNFELDARLSVTGCLFNMLFFIFESLFNLARAIRANGPNQWAKVEIDVFVYYFILIACALLAANIFDDIEAADGGAKPFSSPYIKRIYNKTTVFATEQSIQYGEDFPLYYMGEWLFEKQTALGRDFWYNIVVTGPTLGFVVAVQLCAVAAGFMGESTWVPTLRAVLVIDTIVCLTLYSAMAYISLLSVNLSHNFIALCTIPLCVQLLFALLYAVQSDILPIFENMPTNPVLRAFWNVAYLLPLAALLLLAFGVSDLAFYSDSDDSSRDGGVGVALIIPGAIAGTIVLVGVSLFCVRSACVYYDDWIQMAADMLARSHPSKFGRKPDDDAGDADDDVDENANAKADAPDLEEAPEPPAASAPAPAKPA